MSTWPDPELSRLSFEDRLIEFCEDDSVPLLTRVRMLGIAAGRLDLYFMTRVGRLKHLAAEGKGAPKHGGAAPAEELEIVARETERITRRAYRLLEDQLLPALATHGVRIEQWSELTEQDRKSVRNSCNTELGGLRPVVIRPGQPLPHVRNLRPALVVSAREQATVILELPANLPRLVRIGPRGSLRFVPLEQVLAAQIPSICRETDGADAHLFRVTRNGDVDFDETHNLLDSVEAEVAGRPFQEVIRLEVEAAMPPELRERLMTGFQHEDETTEGSLEERDVCTVDGLMDLTVLEELVDLDLPHLKSPSLVSRKRRIDLRLLESSPSPDELYYFPYDDYDAAITEFLAAAAEHPELTSIKTTVYRTEKDSSIGTALIAARARGAEVTAIVEVKASFDERDNIELARNLAAHGVRVMLSPATLKVHAKIALVTLATGTTRRQVALIGTGNMNSETARSYIDLWLVTARPEATSELDQVFDVLTGSPKTSDFDCLMVAPFDLRTRFIELIDREAAHARAGKPAGIRVMINGLSDPAIIEALTRASQAGVPIDMMVRSVCALTPGVPGISENIRIVSVLGLLLQHARIFHFTNAGDDLYFIGSSDWRPRNLDGRVEVVAHVPQADHTAQLDRILTDTLNSPDGWTLGADGAYSRSEIVSR